MIIFSLDFIMEKHPLSSLWILGIGPHKQL